MIASGIRARRRNYFLAIMYGGLAFGCQQTRTIDNRFPCDENDRIRMSGLQYDAYLTWNNYDGLGDPNEADFVWNGVVVGKGAEGWREVVIRFDELKDRSVVLVFPTFELIRGYNFPPYEYPFEWNEIEKLLRKKRLIVEASCFDNNGTYVGVTRDCRRLNSAND